MSFQRLSERVTMSRTSKTNVVPAQNCEWCDRMAFKRLGGHFNADSSDVKQFVLHSLSKIQVSIQGNNWLFSKSSRFWVSNRTSIKRTSFTFSQGSATTFIRCGGQIHPVSFFQAGDYQKFLNVKSVEFWLSYLVNKLLGETFWNTL